jgi:dethiobiotin synthetase
MNQGIFITGTDTGVGKTVVTAGLAFLLRKHGWDVGVMKPIATGCSSRSGRLGSPDARFLMAAAESNDDPDWVVPYCLRAPLAPFAAAEQEGIPIDLQRIGTVYQQLSDKHDILLVEGIGGLEVPVTRKETVADLIRLLNLPILIVAANRLGTLNHLLLTLRWAQQCGIEVRGIVFNHPDRRKDRSAQTNPPILASLVDTPILGTVPYIEGLSVERLRLDGLGRAFHHLDKNLHHLGIKLQP